MSTETRKELLDWCKKRALEYADMGDVAGALASFVGDMSLHDETREHPQLALMGQLMLGGHLSTVQQAREFIEGFN